MTGVTARACGGIAPAALAVVLLQLVNIGRPMDIFPELRVFRLGVIAVGLTIAAVVIYAKEDRKPPSLPSPTMRKFKALCLLSVLIVPLAVVPAKSVSYLAGTFSLCAFYYFAFCRHVRSRREFDLSVRVMVASSLALSLALVAKGEVGGQRVSTGTTYDPNDIALLFVAVLPLAVGYARLKRGWIRALCVVTALSSLLAIGLTQSRGALLGSVVLLTVWFLQREGIAARRVTWRKCATVVLLLVMALMVFPASYWERMSTMMEKGDTGSGRTTVWPRTVQMMQWHPFGIGPGSFTTVYGRYLSAGRFALSDDEVRNRAWATAHNSFLLVGVELGLLGLALYLAWIGGMMLSLSRLRRVIRRDGLGETLYVWCGMVQLSLVGFVVPAIFLSQSFSYLLLTNAGYVVALERFVAQAGGSALKSGVSATTGLEADCSSEAVTSGALPGPRGGA